MSKDDRFEFGKLTDVPSSEVIAGRGKKLIDRKTKAFFDIYHDQWKIITEVERALDATEAEIEESCEKLSIRTRHHTREKTFERLIKFSTR